MKKLILLLFATVFAVMLSAPQPSFSYSNPLDIPDSWMWDHGDFYGEGDPYILKYNGIYYLYVSTVDDKSGVKVWTSTDLIDWDYGGLVTEEPSTKAAYAPEVTYWNGAFYMYTSPGGNGHYVYKSSSPLGPFVKQTDNLGMGIDGSVFIDDDGQWYFYSTGTNSIMARPMDDPYTFGEAINTGASMDGWTEGSTLLKRNGKYFMTYTGNHIWNKAYRVDYGSSNSPTEGFTNETKQNPILINTEGSHVGLGHNSIVRGPDLDTHYMVYHSHANPGRETNLDRIVWNGDKMLLLGPTTFKQQNPDMPDFSDRFKRNEVGNDWIAVNGGNWSISNDWLEQESLGDTNWHRQVTKNETNDNYTAEFNMKKKEQGSSSNPRFGAVFSYKDEDNYGLAVLSPDKNRLETFFRVDGVDQEWEASELPSDYDYSNLHQVRVEKSNREFNIYVDGMLKQTREIDGLNGGKIGYTTSDVHAEFGFIASSNKVDGSNAFDAYKPLPGSIEAVHYNSGGDGKGFRESTNEINEEYRRDAVDIEANSEGGFKISSFQEGEWLKYNANIQDSGKYDVSLRVASDKNAQVRLRLDDETDLSGVVDVPNTGDGNQWENLSIDGITLPEGNHTIKVEVVQGEFDFASMKVSKHKVESVLFDDFNDGNDDGWTPHDGFWKVDTNTDEPSVFDNYKPLPGVIEAAYYNSGGEGVAYHDTTPENIGGVLRGDSVDIRNKPQGGTAVGWNQTGEWLKYNVNVKETGLYNLRLDASTTFTDAKVRLWLDDETDLTGVIDVPSTGGWNNWTPVTKEGITLPEGEHTITVEIVNGEFDFSRFSFSSFDIHKPLPGLIEAEDYNLGGEGIAYHDKTEENSGGEYRDDGVDIRSTPDDGFAVESFEAEEWLNYDVDIAEEGEYGIDLAVASIQDNAQLKLVLNDTDLIDVMDIPNTGDKNNWETITLKDIHLPKGKHTLKVEAVQGEFDFSKMIFHTFDEYKSLPGKVMAVDYITGGEGIAYHDNNPENIGRVYRQDGVDIRNHPDGTYNIGWNQTGEWYKYNVNMAESGNLNMKMSVTTDLEGGQVRLWLNDEIDLTGVINVPRTGGWDNWSDVVKENVSLPAGNHSITVETVNGEFDFHSIEFYENTEEEEEEEIETDGTYTSSVGTFGKSVIGEKDWKNYSVEADIKLVDGIGDGGLIFRVNNPANGMERAQNNPDFMQGYVAYLNEEGVHLGKQNYNWEYLAGTEMTELEDEWQHMKVVVKDANIKVYVGDMDNPKIDYTDNSVTAFSHGSVGVRSHFSNAEFDNFLVKPIEPSLDSLQKSIELNRDTGNISHSLYMKLHNKLKQSQHHKDKGDLHKASKHLNDFLKHLEKNKADVPGRVYEELNADAASLIDSFESKDE